MKYDPLYLFENKKSRFDKFMQRAAAKQEGAANSDSEGEQPKKKPAKQGKITNNAPPRMAAPAAAAPAKPMMSAA